jgi:hypothetical protein
VCGESLSVIILNTNPLQLQRGSRKGQTKQILNFLYKFSSYSISMTVIRIRTHVSGEKSQVSASAMLVLSVVVNYKVDIRVIVNCNWVETHYQLYGTHLHTNNTHKNTMKQNTQRADHT